MRTKAPFIALVVGLLLPLVASAQARQGEGTSGRSKDEPARPIPSVSNWTSEHSIEIDGQPISYRAVVGSILLRNQEEEVTAELFYTAYLRTGKDGEPDSSRPVMFSFNGGPGSASFWLHMGIMGPRRVVTPEVGPQGPPPYEVEDNAYSVLDKTDIVMIDPVGTGLSRPAGSAEGKDFWGLEQDAASLAQFVRRFLTQYNRWNAPRYLLGESYGTTRSAVLARHLQRSNIDLNGIVLVSSVLDFNTIGFPDGSIVPYVVNVPSYAVTSEYLGVLPGGKPADLNTFMKEVEQWAISDYAAVLFAGSAVDPGKRSQVIDQMHRYTGLSKEYLDNANLRVSAPEYEKELLRDKGLVVGRLDARFTGPTGDVFGRFPSHDPQSTAISSAYTSAWNSYLRSELNYDGEREYVPSGMARPWNWERRGSGGGFGFGGIPNVAPDLATVLTRNPKLEVLLINGIYDLATPYFAAVWTFDNLNLPADLRDNIERADFAAGHMMYVEQSLLPQWRNTLISFLERTSGER